MAVLAVGCSGNKTPTVPPAGPAASRPAASTPAASTPVTRPATTISQFDPRWMTLETPSSWTEADRRVTRDFQQFGLRPVAETELPRNCNGCGVQPPTLFLTAYAPGAFDPAPFLAGQPMTVNAQGDGFFSAAAGSDDAVLAWKYADGAWATARGRTTITSDPERMLEIARALRPGERAAIRVPVSTPYLPATLPLAEISVDRGAYGTTLSFAACGRTDVGAVPDCYGEADSLRIQIWPSDGYAGHIDERRSEPVRIGGRDGLLDPMSRQAAVQVAPGVLVVIELSGPFGQPGQSEPKPGADLGDILATVVWAPDPANEQTWSPVADWAKPA